MLIRLKRDQIKTGMAAPGDWVGFSLWTWLWKSAWGYRLSTWMFRKFAGLMGRRGWLKWLPFTGKGWTKARDLPAPAKTPFRRGWKKDAS
jgi:L-lactate dehydrogenase complex protein LldF